MKIGVLAFHGDFEEHMATLRSLKVESKEVRTLEALAMVDALIIPGGESTVISRFLKMYGLDEELKKKSAKSFPIFGTCAGAIVLAKKITGGEGPKALDLIDIDIDRNAYGTQLDSFDTALNVKGIEEPVQVSFIRAPIVTRVGRDVEILALKGDKPVILKQNNVLVATCHPEMRGETAIHEFFLTMI